jgi:hypothetical protein
MTMNVLETFADPGTVTHPRHIRFVDYKASGESPKDFKAARVMKTMTPKKDIPNVFDMSSTLLPPRDQGSQGSCVGFSAAAMREFHATKNQGIKYHLSPQFLYDYRPDEDAGYAVPRKVLGTLKDIGVAPDQDAPIRPGDGKETPSDIAVRRASAFKIASYWSVSTVEECKVFLFEHGPCIFSTPVWKKPYNSGSLEFYLSAEGGNGDELLGFHMMTFVGYTEDAFIVRNSWGAKWNGNGHFLIKFDHWESVRECWCVVPLLPAMPDPLNMPVVIAQETVPAVPIVPSVVPVVPAVAPLVIPTIPVIPPLQTKRPYVNTVLLKLDDFNVLRPLSALA